MSLPPRQRSQRLVERTIVQERELLLLGENTDQKSLASQGALRAPRKPLTNHNGNTQGPHLYPGLNDITDVFEAIPLDLIRYFTLLKEIDAKCVATTPMIKPMVTRFLELSHPPNSRTNPVTQRKRHELLEKIKGLVKDLLPCLEEKMHVASVAADLMHKYTRRMNDDYELILQNEVPENIRIGPLLHPAMINLDGHKSVAEKTAHTQRSELRREALAAKKAATGDEDDLALVALVALVAGAKNGKPRKDKPSKESTPVVAVAAAKKRRADTDDGSRSSTPAPSTNGSKKRTVAKKKEPEGEYKATTEGDEPVYCYCQQVSFGEMVGCDGEQCTREWFHLSCLGFDTPPKGKWYCDECKRDHGTKRSRK